MKRNIALRVSYDGTAYLGWQKTSTGPSIEASLENAIERILNHPVQLQAASRTDAGVHAEGQIVNFFTGKNIPLDKLLLGINALLPTDIVACQIGEAGPTFHPTMDCQAKEYVYRLCSRPTQSPLKRLYEWHYPHALNLASMREAALLLTGTHPFEAFCNIRKNSVYKDYIREVSSILLEESPESLCIKIRGKNFLYKMVRNLVGTLVYIGRGKMQCADIPRMLESRDRQLIGMTAPAHGLCLKKVFYSAGTASGLTEM